MLSLRGNTQYPYSVLCSCKILLARFGHTFYPPDFPFPKHEKKSETNHKTEEKKQKEIKKKRKRSGFHFSLIL